MMTNTHNYTATDVLSCLLHIFSYNSSELPKAEDDQAENQIKKFNDEQVKQDFEIPISVEQNQLSPSFIAGICIMDIIQNKTWSQLVFERDDKIIPVSEI